MTSMRLPAGSAQQDYNAVITSQLHVTCTEQEAECHTLGAQYISSCVCLYIYS